jgi:hypothetical protein
MKTTGNLILMTTICVIIFWVFMALRPANAIVLGCGSSWTICKARAYNRAHPAPASPRVGCGALCQAKCDATSRNPAACYVKWDRINRAGKGAECEKSLGLGRGCQ